MDLLCEWAIEDPTSSSSWLDYARMIWVGAPELVMERPSVVPQRMIKAVSLWTDDSKASPWMKDRQVAARKMIESVSRWTLPRPPGWRANPVAVGYLYDSIEAFYMAMQLSLVWPDEDPELCRVAGFMKWAFPILVVAPVLRQIPPCAADARASVLDQMRLSMHKYGEYVAPLLAACAALVPWMSPALSPCIADACIEPAARDRRRFGTETSDPWRLEALLMALSVKGSTFWNVIRRESDRKSHRSGRSLCVLSFLMRRHNIRKHIGWDARQKGLGVQWKEYILMRAYAVMTPDDVAGACMGTVKSFEMHRIECLYNMLTVECGAATVSKAATTADAMKTIKTLSRCLLWPGVHRERLYIEYEWTVSLLSCISLLARQVACLWWQGARAQHVMNSILPCQSVVRMVMEYLAPPTGSVPKVLCACMRIVRTLELHLANDSRFERPYMALLKSVLLFHASKKSLGPGYISDADAQNMRSILHDGVVTKPIRGLMGC